MTTMMDRLCEAALDGQDKAAFDENVHSDMDEARVIVTAILKVLREPDEAMVAKAATAVSGAPFPSKNSTTKARAALVAAIDHVLEDKE